MKSIVENHIAIAMYKQRIGDETCTRIYVVIVNYIKLPCSYKHVFIYIMKSSYIDTVVWLSSASIVMRNSWLYLLVANV